MDWYEWLSLIWRETFQSLTFSLICHTSSWKHTPVFPSRRAGLHRPARPREPGAEARRPNCSIGKLNRRTITCANDVAAIENTITEEGKVSAWERWRTCFHSYLIGHVPPPASHHTKLKYIILFLLFWLVISKAALILLAPHKRTLCEKKLFLLLQLPCRNLI